MKAERIGLVGVTAALLVGALFAALAGVAPGNAPTTAASATSYPPLLEWVLWGTLGLFAAVAGVWVLLTYVVGAGYEPPAPEHGPEEVQVRILTVDVAAIVQRTVDVLPDALDDVHVIAEEPLDVAGAAVHVVPDGFECDAVRKGRAIKWTRRELTPDREFVLYLDEDSLLEAFEGLPDADVVQLQERPRRTGSVLSYLADVYRMGVQLEQRAFARLSIPLFAWGGGIAARADLENEVTWDRETLVEDTAFVWAAFERFDADFALAESVCRNEAPPSLYEVAQQRRRWAAGNLPGRLDAPGPVSAAHATPQLRVGAVAGRDARRRPAVAAGRRRLRRAVRAAVGPVGGVHVLLVSARRARVRRPAGGAGAGDAPRAAGDRRPLDGNRRGYPRAPGAVPRHDEDRRRLTGAVGRRPLLAAPVSQRLNRATVSLETRARSSVDRVLGSGPRGHGFKSRRARSSLRLSLPRRSSRSRWLRSLPSGSPFCDERT